MNINPGFGISLTEGGIIQPNPSVCRPHTREKNRFSLIAFIYNTRKKRKCYRSL